ncbi:MAG: hypothetical protein EHM64_09105 [Ignavibacteriae bacterium]|nr:MAG: hypothetical protein EHM64_09105 [Ignavibacteriota bacterium]
MNTGQMMLILCAMSILAVLTLSINSSIVNASVLGFNMEVNLDAISIAQSTLDEILYNDFDQNTINDTRAFEYTDITPAGLLGPDGAGEQIDGGVDIEDTTKVNDFQSKTKFNDVDDYDGYHRKAWNPRLGWFDVRVVVTYVSETNPDVVESDRTFYKRVTVTVTHPNMITDSEQHIIPMVIRDLAVYRRYF